MLKIRQIHDLSSKQNATEFNQVLEIYEQAFSYYPQYTKKIAELFNEEVKKDFIITLFVIEGNKARIKGFALIFFFPELKYAYLDYIAIQKSASYRGYGAALYDISREWLLDKKCYGLFMDVPPDVPELLKDTSSLAINKKRMAFYEEFGAYPIIGTKYEQITHAANQGYFTYLVYDSLSTNKPLSAKHLKDVVKKILFIKGGLAANDKNVVAVLRSIKDNPIKLREPVYFKPNIPKRSDSSVINLVSTGDAHQIHHLKEKGYIQRPARINFILKGLEGLNIKNHKVKKFPDHYITDVHDKSLYNFLRSSSKLLDKSKLIYPNVFPVRNNNKLPKSIEMQSGYFCIDTFTPVTSNSFLAAKNAVNAALTGAELINKGADYCYILCRPPGHHAERKLFGGFCYLNSAAISANYLSKYGKVLFVDIDYHHGNGSQDIFYERNDVYFVSIHGHPSVSYPYFSGYTNEKGEGVGLGYNKNVPLYPGITDNDYLMILESELNPIIEFFKPLYLVISLGLDIMAGDPTGQFNISSRGIYRIGKYFSKLNLPTLVVQEGGYTLRNLKYGSHSFFSGLAT